MFPNNGSAHNHSFGSNMSHSPTPAATPPPTTSFGLGDGSWELRIYVTDLQMDRVLRVKSDVHIGGVMLRLVEDLDIAIDWSDHALWWPDKNTWLTHTRSTLDQCGVTATAELEFTPMHKILRVQLPDLREMDFRVDFSVKTFNAVVSLCKQMGIRHPEELSFSKPVSAEDLKYNYAERQMKKVSMAKTINGQIPADTNSFVANKSHNSSNGSLERSSHHTPGSPSTPVGTLRHHNTSASSNGYNSSMNTSSGSNIYETVEAQEQLNNSLTNSPSRPPDSSKTKPPRPKTLLEKARMNVGWLDSSLSIMEQGVREGHTLLLRFKFYSFYDLNPIYDGARINLIYNQAKYAIINEEIDCTEEEMLMFAALQLQVNMQVLQPQHVSQTNTDDDIDRALNELQVSLEGGNQLTPNIPGSSDIMNVPELKGNLKFMKPRRFTLKSYKMYFFVCRDMRLSYYRSSDEADLLETIDLRGCEVTPDVVLATGRYGIRLEVPAKEQGMTEYMLRCNDEDQYARWMAAMRLASKGKSLADSSYQSEVRGIQAFLSLQQPARNPVQIPEHIDIHVEDFLAPRFVRKIKGKGQTRILEAHSNVKELGLVEAKMQFIRAWQALPEFGLTLFLVKYMGHKKEELLGVAFNRIMKMELNTGDHIKTLRYNTIKAWNVNWGTKNMMIQAEGDPLVFSCLTADCKVVHEFIGGYIFLSMRTKDANQTLNEELFHKLTGGWA
uniref:Unc-112-related protein-like n=1 Tax=Hirondellea gigas TaxID=1518452 RepID=A0A2P2I202_9CRUS